MRLEDRVVIGWNEYVDLPDWGVSGLRAKIDTGARTSAIHVEDIEELPRERVRFDVVLHREKRDRRVSITAPVVRHTRVRSSTGHYTQRFVVATRMLLGGVEREIELSLVDREKMIFRMLLGRSALKAPFLIDAAHRAALGRPRSSRPGKKKKKKKKVKKETAKRATAEKAKGARRRLRDR